MEQRHHVDFRRRSFFALGVTRSAMVAGVRTSASRRRDSARTGRHHVQVLQMLVEIGVNAVDLGERSLIELL